MSLSQTPEQKAQIDQVLSNLFGRIASTPIPADNSPYAIPLKLVETLDLNNPQVWKDPANYDKLSGEKKAELARDKFANGQPLNQAETEYIEKMIGGNGDGKITPEEIQKWKQDEEFWNSAKAVATTVIGYEAAVTFGASAQNFAVNGLSQLAGIFGGATEGRIPSVTNAPVIDGPSVSRDAPARSIDTSDQPRSIANSDQPRSIGNSDEPYSIANSDTLTVAAKPRAPAPNPML